MKALLFLAHTFSFTPFAPSLPGVDAVDLPPGEQVDETVVAFVHCEDEDVDKRSSVMGRMHRQVKWLASKMDLHSVVLHSFTHLSASKSAPDFAEQFIEELAERLRRNGYRVSITPFGYTCSWTLSVYGESIAKVFVQF